MLPGDGDGDEHFLLCLSPLEVRSPWARDGQAPKTNADKGYHSGKEASLLASSQMCNSLHALCKSRGRSETSSCVKLHSRHSDGIGWVIPACTRSWIHSSHVALTRVLTWPLHKANKAILPRNLRHELQTKKAFSLSHGRVLSSRQPRHGCKRSIGPSSERRMVCRSRAPASRQPFSASGI